jgi:glycerol-3-phosphate dehydrogenase subunit B
MADLIVVGAGLAGLVAAHAAARAGMKVKVISKGMGALHWSAGTVGVLGYYPNSQTAVNRPLETVKSLAHDQPNHPYAIGDRADLSSALADFVELSHEIGLPYFGAEGIGDNIWLPSPVGSARPTFLAPQAQIAGDLGRSGAMLIVGLRGMRDFYPELIAENLRKQGYSARAGFLPIDVITDRNDTHPVQLALGLDNPVRQTSLAAALQRLVRSNERIGLPAILGMDDHAGALERLKSRLGAPVFEIPTLPPSVPGIRLNTALRRQLAKQGVRVEMNADVVNFAGEKDRVVYMETGASGRPLRHRADIFLLATGGILGGGIDSDHTGRVWETVLDLPLDTPRSRAEWFSGHFFHPAGHPIFRAGVTVNRRFQPVDSRGELVFANVWAAGGLLAHADPVLEHSLEGIAIVTGTEAARCAARS